MCEKENAEERVCERGNEEGETREKEGVRKSMEEGEIMHSM